MTNFKLNWITLILLESSPLQLAINVTIVYWMMIYLSGLFNQHSFDVFPIAIVFNRQPRNLNQLENYKTFFLTSPHERFLWHFQAAAYKGYSDGSRTGLRCRMWVWQAPQYCFLICSKGRRKKLNQSSHLQLMTAPLNRRAASFSRKYK